MEWFEKFKVGQEVRVVKKVECWKYGGGSSTRWNTKYMDKTIGKIYEIKEIGTTVGYKLHTQIPTNWDGYLYDYWYPAESLEEVNVKGRQLLFNFWKG